MKHHSALLLLFALTLWIPAFGQYSDLPVTLSLPYDQDTIDETEPTFVWQSNLAAVQTDPRLSQQIRVVEMGADQTPGEAIAINQPVFIRQNLVSNSIAYSASDYELKRDVWYAWQVSYLFNGMVIQQSEVWKFIRATPVEPPRQYIALRRQADGTIYTTSEPALYIKINEQGLLGLKATISNSSGIQKEVLITPDGSEEGQLSVVCSSDLFCKVDLKPLDLKEGNYTFSWTAPSGQAYSLQFNLQD